MSALVWTLAACRRLTPCLCALGVLVAAGPSAAGPTPLPPEQTAQIRTGIGYVYDMQYARAEQTFADMVRQAPEDPAGYVFLAYTYWVQELNRTQQLSIMRFAASGTPGEASTSRPPVDAAAEIRIRSMNRQAIEKARARLERNRDDRAALFLRGLAYQNLACFEVSLKGSWWSAFRTATKTYRDHKALLALDPDLHDARLSIGVYRYAAGSLNWSVRWLAYALGYHGSKQKGKKDMELAAAKGDLLADDALVMLAVVSAREKDYAAAMRHLTALSARHPLNYVVRLDLAGLAVVTGHPEKAVEIYDDVLRKQDTRAPGYDSVDRAMVLCRLGVAHRERGNTEGALALLNSAVAQPGASESTVVVARLELGKTLDLAGRRSEALGQYRRVKAAPDVAGSRQEAGALERAPYRR